MAINITSAEQGSKLDAQNRANFFSNLSKEIDANDPSQLRIQRKLNNIPLDGINSATSNDVVSNTPANQPISSATISGNQSPLKLPQKTPDTSYASLSGVASAVKDTTKEASQIQRDLETKQIEAQNKASEGESAYKQAYSKVLETFGLRETLGKEQKVAEKTQKVTDYTNQLEALDRAEINEQRALESANMTDVGRSNASKEIARKYAFQKADVALLQSAANRDLLTAETIISNTINARLEPLKLAMEFTRNFYEDNKDSLDKADQNLFSLKIKQDERNYDEAQNRLQDISKIQLSAVESGAPASVIQAIGRAKTAGEAMQLGAGYIGSLDRQIKQAQLAKLQIDAKEAMKKISETPTGTGVLPLAQQKGNIDLISGLGADKYLSTAVGPNTLVRTSFLNVFTGGKSNFVAGVEQLRSQLTLDSLISAKARGATFGALSEGELKTLSASASKLGTWAIKDEDGNVIGYKTSEGEFKKEIDKINNFAKLDYLIKGGSPEDVGAQQLEDGTIWVANTDGSFTQIYP